MTSPSPEVPHGMTRGERYAFYAVLLISFFGIVLWFLTVQRMQMVERQILENRAVGCRILAVQGVVLQPDGPCLDRNLTPYFDTEETSAEAERERASDEQFLRINCKVLEKVGERDSACYKALGG